MEDTNFIVSIKREPPTYWFINKEPLTEGGLSPPNKKLKGENDVFSVPVSIQFINTIVNEKIKRVQVYLEYYDNSVNKWLKCDFDKESGVWKLPSSFGVYTSKNDVLETVNKTVTYGPIRFYDKTSDNTMFRISFNGPLNIESTRNFYLISNKELRSIYLTKWLLGLKTKTFNQNEDMHI